MLGAGIAGNVWTGFGSSLMGFVGGRRRRLVVLAILVGVGGVIRLVLVAITTATTTASTSAATTESAVEGVASATSVIAPLACCCHVSSVGRGCG